MKHKEHHDKNANDDDKAGKHAHAADAAKVAGPGPECGCASCQPGDADDLATVKAQRDDYLARLQRLSADFSNYQKRAVKEAIESRDAANADLIKNLLAVVDDMERAIEAARVAHSEQDALFKGMELVHAKALETLSRFGLEAIQAQGKSFEPHKHQAVMQMADNSVPPGMVLKELQKGYMLHGRILRPSTVVVSKAPDATETPSE
jgi:molecular chaperone GrpE